MTEYILRTNKQASGISDGDWDTELSKMSMTDIFCTLKTKLLEKYSLDNMKDVVPEPPVEFWNIDTQFGRAGKYINHPANLPTITLNDL